MGVCLYHRTKLRCFTQTYDKFIDDFEDVALIHQLLINSLKSVNNPNYLKDSLLDSPFYKRPVVEIKEKLSEVYPEVDEVNQVLVVFAPKIENETNEQSSVRKQNLVKEYLPVIASMNTAKTKELFNWFISTADTEAIVKFSKKLEEFKKVKLSKSTNSIKAGEE